MIVYRVENNAGTGPYRDGAISLELEDAIDDMMGNRGFSIPFFRINYPLPREDGIMISNGREWECGFSTLEQFHHWFYDAEVIERLNDEGFYLYEFEVPEEFIKRGRHQCEFVRAHAIRKDVVASQKAA